MEYSQPKSAYVHVPFCRHRCGYCNFSVVAGRDDLIDDYLAAMQAELSLLGAPRTVATIFLGGGTPTHLDSYSLARLLDMIGEWLPLSSGGEYSCEANPEDISSECIRPLADAGVNRISLGVQSFQAKKLRVLERAHDAKIAARAIQVCRDHGMDVSIDLIFGAPGESLDAWRADLESALAVEPDHISTYGLTFERGAAFWAKRNRGELHDVGDDVEARMYELAIDRLTDSAFEHYEVSNFARTGKRCRHNETYWLGESYFAAGPGASRFVDGRRETNHRSTTTYIRRLRDGQSPVQEVDDIPLEARIRERFVFAMRMLDGVNCREFQATTGVDPRAMIGEQLERYVSLELLEFQADTIRLTRKGLMVSDSIWADLL